MSIMGSASDITLEGLGIIAADDIITTTSTVTVTKVHSSTVYLNIVANTGSTTATSIPIFEKRSNNFLNHGTTSSTSMSNSSMIVAIVVPVSVVAVGLLVLLIWHISHRKQNRMTTVLDHDYVLNSKYRTTKGLQNITEVEARSLDGILGGSDKFQDYTEGEGEEDLGDFKMYETKYLGPVKYNWVNTPASAIKAFFNRKSVYGFKQPNDNSPELEDISSFGSMPFTDTVTGDLASPAYVTLKPFKLFNRKHTQNGDHSLLAKTGRMEKPCEPNYEPQILTNSKIPSRKVPILSEVPVANKNVSLIKIESRADINPHQTLDTGSTGCYQQTPITPRISSKTPGTPLGETLGLRKYIVIRKYDKNIDDEISVSLGELVWVLHEFSDGWCKVKKITKNTISETGMIPGLCLAAAK